MAVQSGRRSAGAEKLARLFSPRVTTKTALAASLHVSTQTIWAWVRGLARPRLELMIELKKRYGIDPADWAFEPAPEPKPRKMRVRKRAARAESAPPEGW